MRSRSETLVTTMGTGPCIVDLSDEDDDEDVVFLTEFPAHLSHRPSRKLQSDTAASLLNSDLVILSELVDINPELDFGTGPQKQSQKFSQNSSLLLDEDDCCILDEDPSRVDIVKTSCGGNDSDDLVMTGEVGQVACRDFPHARHLCVQFPFKTTPHKSFCSQCHCYVCDMLAPCSLWGDGTRVGDHCHASDKIGERWKLLRQYNKTHPTGCSDPSALQQLLYPGKSSAGNSESTSFRELLGCQTGDFARSQHPLQRGDSPRSQHHLQQVESARSQHPLQRGDTARSHHPLQRGDSARSQHPLQRGDSTRSQHPVQRYEPARPKYPLQIPLNRPNRDPRSFPRRHPQGIGVRAAKFHMYLHRKDPHCPSTYRSYQPDGDRGCQPRRTPQRNGPISNHPPLPCPHPGSVQRSHGAFSTGPPRRPTPADTPVGRESFGGMVPNEDMVSEKDLLGELAAGQTYLASCSPDRPEDIRQQCHNSETSPAPNFGSADLLDQNEIGAYSSQGDRTVESCNSILVDTQFNGGSFIEGIVAGTIDSLPTSPPTLLADYLLNGDDFWDDLPENFVKQGM
ncbi:unnamed protein product [Calypogeia fissa]